jgi:chromosomal replication initiation ATPase DnaA
MTFAEQQHRAHIERQRRLGKIAPASVQPAIVLAPSLVPQPKPEPEPLVSAAQARTITALQQKVAQLSAQLKALLREDATPLAVPRQIKPVIRTVAKYYGVSLTDLLSCRRSRSVARPRHVAMYLAKKLTRHSLPAIGRVLDRDHSTIMHGCRRIATLRLEDAKLDAEIRELIGLLTQAPQHD